MRLKILKHLLDSDLFSEDEINKTADVINEISNIDELNQNTKDTLISFMSDLYGYLELKKMVSDGMSKEEAINSFAKRVINTLN
jgi:hypothetical protein